MEQTVWISIIAFVVTGIVFSALCRSIARQKGFEKTGRYAFCGFLFSLLALIYVAGLPDLKARPATAGTAASFGAAPAGHDPALVAVLTAAVATVLSESPAPANRPVFAAAAPASSAAPSGFAVAQPSQAGFVIRQIRRV